MVVTLDIQIVGKLLYSQHLLLAECRNVNDYNNPVITETLSVAWLQLFLDLFDHDQSHHQPCTKISLFHKEHYQGQFPGLLANHLISKLYKSTKEIE